METLSAALYSHNHLKAVSENPSTVPSSALGLCDTGSWNGAWSQVLHRVEHLPLSVHQAPLPPGPGNTPKDRA